MFMLFSIINLEILCLCGIKCLCCYNRKTWKYYTYVTYGSKTSQLNVDLYVDVGDGEECGILMPIASN